MTRLARRSPQAKPELFGGNLATPAGSARVAQRALGTRALVALVAVLAIGVAVRSVAIDRLPGINGDEAWYGANVHLLLDGERPFLRTGVGNVLSPLHSGLLLGLEKLAGPSFVLLRLPSVMWGCVAVTLAYFLLAPLIGARAAVIFTGILALSPAAVSQARFGWDPSATILLSLLTVAFTLDNRRWLSVTSFLLSLIAHPTNIFLAPIVAAQWGPQVVEYYRSCSAAARRRIWTIVAIVLPVTAGMALYVARILAHAGFLPSVELVIERLTSPLLWYAFGLGMISLFSGATSTAIAGTPPPALSLIANLLVVVSFVLASVGYWSTRREVGTARAMWFIAGLVVSIVSFHVVAGPRALEPGTERYAMFLVVPLAIFCAWGLDALGTIAYTAGAVLCGLLAVVLTFGYFQPLVAEGGHGPSFYRTGPIEPKLAAFDFVNAHSRDVELAAVFAEDWWLYWPIRYLAWHERRLHVEMLGHYDRWLVPPGGARRQYARPPDRVYAVVFHGTEYAQALVTSGTTLFSATDPLGRPILDVVLVPADAYADLRVAIPWSSRP